MNRKGITPVIATVLLIAISVSAIVTASIFIGDLVGDFRSGITDQLGVEDKESKAEMTVIQGYDSGGNIWIEVRNEGSISVLFKEDDEKLWNLYVDGEPATGWGAADNNLANQDTVVVDPRETLMIDTGTSFPSQGSSKTIEIDGQYGISSAIVCDNVNGENSC